MLPPVAPVVVIQYDPGGIVGEFEDRLSEYYAAGVKVRILGDCISACTLVTQLPRDNVCVGPDASLQFHAPFDDQGVRRKEWTRAMRAGYPADVGRWIDKHGGLGLYLIKLKGAALRRLFHICKGSL